MLYARGMGEEAGGVMRRRCGIWVLLISRHWLKALRRVQSRDLEPKNTCMQFIQYAHHGIDWKGIVTRGL